MQLTKTIGKSDVELRAKTNKEDDIALLLNLLSMKLPVKTCPIKGSAELDVDKRDYR
jgi:hypothetical protein